MFCIFATNYNIMKALQILILFFFFSLSGQKVLAQSYRFKTSSLSVMEKDKKGKWGKWSDFKKAELIIELDGKKNRIIVNSEQLQLFNIISYGAVTENDADKTVPFMCEDNNGAPCMIMIITRKKENKRMQIYINYQDLKMVYNVYN